MSNERRKVVSQVCNRVNYYAGHPNDYDYEYCTFQNCSFFGINVSGTSFQHCIFIDCNYIDCNLNSANFFDVLIRSCRFINCCLTKVILDGVVLYGQFRECDFQWIHLHAAMIDCIFTNCDNLSTAHDNNCRYLNPYLENSSIGVLAAAKLHIVPSEGEFIAWKALCGRRIAKLLIPESAARSSSGGRKCRASKAFVLSITGENGENYSEGSSIYDLNFVYKVNELVEEPAFHTNPWEECAAGIHFFMTELEARKYAGLSVPTSATQVG